MPSLDLLEQQSEDRISQENVQRIAQYINEQTMRKFEGKHFDVSFAEVSATTTRDYRHHLSFRPVDLIQTFLTITGGVGSLDWNYDDFTGTVIPVTLTVSSGAPTFRVRFLLGRYEEQ